MDRAMESQNRPENNLAKKDQGENDCFANFLSPVSTFPHPDYLLLGFLGCKVLCCINVLENSEIVTKETEYYGSLCIIG